MAAIEVTDISAGDYHSCARLSDQTVKCWGVNSFGELGDGTSTNRSTPVLASGITTATQVSGGYSHSCARLSDHTVKCWGWNSDGQLGNGTQMTSYTPVSVSGISTATQVAAGRYHSCALLSDQTVKCWGGNFSGQLGDGTTTRQLTAVAVTGITTATEIGVGNSHSCALLLDNTVKCWGGNSFGQLGNGTTTGSLTPVSVSGITTATQITVGADHNCVALLNGTAKCWGYNAYRQLGDGTTINRSIPVSVSGMTTATQLAAGEFHSCARLSDSTLKCWGLNSKGQLGDGTTTNRSSPVLVSGITTGTEVTAGTWHSCARLADGTAKCWGWNIEGQLGDGTFVDSLVPVTVLIDGSPPPSSPPLEQSTGTCGLGVHAYSRSACRSSVNTLSGAFTTQVVDLGLPGIGVPFAWTRTYTSSDASGEAKLGAGWTHSYATSLTDVSAPLTRAGSSAAVGGGDLVLYGDEGQRILFELEQNGSYTGASGTHSTLGTVAGGFEVLRRDQVAYRYDTQGRLTSIRDRNNQGLSFAYDALGQLQTITDSLGRQIVVTTSGGRITRIALPDGRYVEYGYTSGLLTSARDAGGGTTLYAYDSAGRLEKITDQNGHEIVRNTYDPTSDRVTDQYDALDNHSSFAWDEQTSIFTDARNNEWEDVYSENQVAERRNPLGHTTRFEYDDDLNVLAVTDPRGNATTMTYEGANLRTRTAPAPFSYQEEWTYTARNDPETYTDGRGLVTSYGYDSAGNLTSILRPDADGPGPLGRPQTTYGRDPGGTGLLVSITDPRGKQTQFSYTSGNLSEVRTHLGIRTTRCYDGSGRLIGIVDPRGTQSCALPNDYRWTYSYSDRDQLEGEVDPLGNQTALDYDLAGNLTTRTDANTRVTSFVYDDANRLETVTAPDPDGGGSAPAPVTHYDYDGVGNVVTQTDANLHQTTFEYDSANRLSQTTAPLNRVWTYGYDATGNLIDLVDANGNATPISGDGQTVYGYDVLNRLNVVNYLDATPDVTFAYDGNDNRTQMSDGSGAETYVYDPLDRLQSVTRGSNVFSYGYDLLNLTRATYPGGFATDYAYDDDERLQSSSSGGLTTTHAYDAAGNLRTTTLPSANGYIETRTYDRAGRLIDVESKRGPTIRAKFAITPDPVGNPVQIVRTGSLAQTQTYAYDGMDRLTGVCFQAGSCPGGSDPFVRWSYDGVGNRLTEARPTGTTSYTYNAADELTQAGSTAYTYDQNGNELSAGSRTFTYDLANRLKATTQGSTTTAYLYDGLGKRLQASTGTAANAKTNFLWDVNRALAQLALERNGNNVLQRRYVYGLRRIQQAVGTASYYLYDGLGSVVNTTSATGGVQRTLSYEPYGTIRTQSGSGPTNFWHFAGEYADPTGLYHLRARQYDTTTGRFLSHDPLGGAGSAYAYVGNSPTAFVDPAGQARLPSFCLLWCSSGGPPSAAHTALDFLGLFPILGEPADAVNCLWYGAEGDYVNAGLSCSAAVPVIGAAATGAKLARRIDAAVDAAKAGAGGAGVTGQGFRSFSSYKRALGPAGPDKQWHHLVEQTPGNVGRFGSEAVHNTGNVVPLDTLVHRRISGYYSSKQPFTGGQTVRQWLSAQPYEAQQRFGVRTLDVFAP